MTFYTYIYIYTHTRSKRNTNIYLVLSVFIFYFRGCREKKLVNQTYLLRVRKEPSPNRSRPSPSRTINLSDSPGLRHCFIDFLFRVNKFKVCFCLRFSPYWHVIDHAVQTTVANKRIRLVNAVAFKNYETSNGFGINFSPVFSS